MLKIKQQKKCKRKTFGSFFLVLVNTIIMNNKVYKCNDCKYAIFKYDDNYKLKYVYCNRIKDKLGKTGYKRLKFCIYYEEKQNELYNLIF